MRASLPLFVCVLAATSCARNGSLVVVDVTAAPAGVARLHGTATLASRTTNLDIAIADPSSATHSFGIRFDPGDSGEVFVELEGDDAAGNRLGSGQGQANIVVGGVTDLDVTLGFTPDGGMDLAVDDLAEGDATCVSPACPASAPVCVAGVCGACTGTGYNADCIGHSADTPLCGSGRCGPCVSHSDCPAGVCATDGHCVDATEIAYVSSTSCPTPDGSMQHPFCQITDALGTSRPYILATGGGYGPLMVTRSVTIIGPGVVGGTFAAISGSAGTPAVAFAPSAAPATLRLDGLSIVGELTCAMGSTVPLLQVVSSQVVSAMGSVGVDAGDCTIDIESSKIIGNANGGISLGKGAATIVGNNISSNTEVMADVATGWGVFQESTGALFLDRNYISNNARGGVSLYNATSWTMTNNFIVMNPGAGVVVGDPGTFQFNTVADNTGLGVSCQAGGISISDSILWHSPAGMPPHDVGCVVSKNVIGADQPTSANEANLDPTFSGNYSLTVGAAPNLACCVDKVTPPTGVTLTGHDYFGTHRPLGAAWDIGAHEVQ